MIRVEHLHKQYGTEAVLQGVGFTLTAGRCLAVLGRSGSGKTTLLRILAGQADADQGTATVNDKDLLRLPPERRGVVYLSQEPLLFPHLDVFENVAFGLRLRAKTDTPLAWGMDAARQAGARWGLGKGTTDASADNKLRFTVQSLLQELDLADHADKLPAMLSGGQKQRAAFGRALIIRPDVVLLDEPFASLDAPTRADMQALFRQVSRKYGITSLLVTHDVREALVLGDDLARLTKGKLHVYPDRAAFVADPDSGVADERAFWTALDGRDDAHDTVS